MRTDGFVILHPSDGFSQNVSNADLLDFGTSARIRAVSYTHLDVYKRQDEYCGENVAEVSR